jgi:hypothetical protein
MNARNFALILGVIYALVGILGFIPGALYEPPANAPDLAVSANYGYMFGLFPVNILHTLFHLAIGIWGIVAAREIHAARKYAQVVAVVYGVLTVFGLIPGLRTVFGLIPLQGHDVWLHALTAIAAAYFGFKTSKQEDFMEHGTIAK